MAWAPCAPVFVRDQLSEILARDGLLDDTRRRIATLRAGLVRTEASSWACRLPVLAGPGAPPGVVGGTLVVAACDPGVHAPRGARPMELVLDAEALRAVLGGKLDGTCVGGLPGEGDALVVGRSGTAAAWLACQARETGRRIPDDVVVSADLVPGPDGVPRLAPVDGGDAKAAVVAREHPGARLFLCGSHDHRANVVELEAGASVKQLEHLVWGNAATTDRVQLSQIAAVARDAFDAHDYARAAPRYQRVVEMAGPEDGELLLEACLRLGAVAVHCGRPDEANGWFIRAEAVPMPSAKVGRYLTERLGALAGMHIDRFEPVSARRILEGPLARRARELGNPDGWERIQMLGAWRRLLLLEGAPEAARDVQIELLAVVDKVERPRVLVDLAWTEIRCGELERARGLLVEAHEQVEQVAGMYRLQTRAFLTWHVGRLAARGGSLEGLEGLLTEAAIDGLLADPSLQAAPRWRLQALRAVRSGAIEELATLSGRLTPFQRWHLGVFLLEYAEAWDVGVTSLRTSGVDLSGMPVLADALERLAQGMDVGAMRVVQTRVGY